VTPIGLGAGAPLVIAPSTTAVVAAVESAGAVEALGVAEAVGDVEPAGEVTKAVARVDSLAPGAKLAFAGRGSDLSTDAPQSAGFFLGAGSAVPVARSTTRVPLAPRPVAVPPPGKESRRARRRRLGIPRRITIRVLLFVLLVAAVPTAAYYAIRWYAYDNWFLALQGKQIVIKQGHPGGVLWFNPKVVDRPHVTTSQILPTGVSQIRGGVQEATLAASEKYVKNLRAEYLFLHSEATNQGTGANAVGPSGSIPNITAPPTTTTTTTTTTVPGATTTTTAAPPP
jgi:hypothetical protein